MNKRLIKKEEKKLQKIRTRIEIHKDFLVAYVKRLEREQYRLGKCFVCSVDIIKRLIHESFDKILLKKTDKQLGAIVKDIK